MPVRRAIVATALVATCAGCGTAPAWHARSLDHATDVTVRHRRGRACVRAGAHGERCYDAVNLTAMTFAARSGSVVYAARVGDEWVMVHDGRAGAPWRGVASPVVSPDGRRVSYAATDGRHWRIVDDGTPGPSFDAILPGSLTLDASGRRLAYAARLGDSTFVVVDGIHGRGWTGVRGLRFSALAERVAFVATLGDRTMPVVDGTPLSAHQAVGEIAFSPSGRSFSYAALDSGVWYVREATARIGPFASVTGLAYLADGARESPTFVARSERGEAVVVHGAPQRWHARVTAHAVAPGGGRWGYIADDTVVYLDGDRLAVESAASELVIASGGARYAYLAAGPESMSVVHDGERSTFDLIVDGTLQYLDGSTTWACLAGDRARRELFVVVDGRRTDRRLDWAELMRNTDRGVAGAADWLRQWVAAEARFALPDSETR